MDAGLVAQVDASREELAALILNGAQSLLEAIITEMPRGHCDRIVQRLQQLTKTFLDDDVAERNRKSVGGA